MNQSIQQQGQNYHAANYRGNQPGHDQYLRSDSQQPSQMARMGQGQSSTFQPAGFVQSSYQGNQQQMNGFQMSNNQRQQLSNQQQYQSPNSFHTANYRGDQPGHDNQPSQQQQFQNPNSFHTANYRGDQPGHDQYLRSDSQQPSQQQFRGSMMPTNSYMPVYSPQQQQQQQQSFRPTSAYHTANYRGNQPNHDQYLRSDSQQPSQMGAAQGQANRPGFVQSYYQPQQQQQQQQNQQMQSGQRQFQSPSSFHTASYRGNQPGHDQYLRSDSTQPNQQQQPYSFR